MPQAIIRRGSRKGNPMARDSQPALVALNRFGFGARGGASGDFVNAASDPRGFVKAELEPPQRRAARSARTAVDPGTGARRCSPIRRRSSRRARPRRRSAASPSKPASRRDVATKHRPACGERRHEGAAPMRRRASAEAMQPNAAKQPRRSRSTSSRKPTAPRRWRGCSARCIADCGFTERLVAFWSNHFCISANKGELARMWAGSFEREAIRPHVLGRFADMLKAVEQHPAMLFFLDNQQSLGPGLPRRAKPQARAERKSRARDHGAAYARRRRRLHPGRRDLAGAHHHRLDLCRTAGTTRRARQLRVQRQCASAGRAASARQGL